MLFLCKTVPGENKVKYSGIQELKKSIEYPVVIVTWLDHTGDAAWKTLEEIQTSKHSTCETIGWLVYEDKEVIKVYDSKTDTGEWGGESIILKKLIKKRDILEF